jgi:hypothetical protein
MRTAALLSVVLFLSFADHSIAQTTPPAPGTGETVQPQGPTGPINTQSGGAPASSPQGETPPGMQSAPQGSGTTAPPGQTKDNRK